MNIFVVDNNPRRAARMLCDKHVVKMCVETAQLLCTAYPKGQAPYRQTHMQHPCAVWCRASRQNYAWLIQHGKALCKEYTYRYHKTHKSEAVIEWCERQQRQLQFARQTRTAFAQAMPEHCRRANAVDAYRVYYMTQKRHIATWKYRPQPTWWK